MDQSDKKEMIEYPEEKDNANTKDNPIIEEEKAYANNLENPYLQNQDQEEQFHIDGFPEKPIMGEEVIDNQDQKDPDQEEDQQEGEGELNLTDEEMFEIAENALLKVAH